MRTRSSVPARCGRRCRPLCVEVDRCPGNWRSAVYIAGQTGRDATGKLAGAPGEFRAQATQAFENLKNALAAVDASFEHVVKLNNYLVDITAHFPIYREVRDKYVNKENPPASTTVQVGKLARDDLLFEVEAIAILPPK
jgi:enamine deaminase RidA (YjgF/YER057c/UK114 family)